jgi:hypothetical protein
MTPLKAYKKCYEEKKRIPDLEEIIAIDAKYSYLYSYQIIKAPWEQGELIISTNPEFSYYYARNVIKGPFKKSHNIIFNSKFKDNYIKLLKTKEYDYSEWLI